MKTLYLTLLSILCICCSSPETGSEYENQRIGDITWYTNDGKELKKWNSAVIGYGPNSWVGGTKVSSVNFQTDEGEQMFINGGMILVSNIRMKELEN